MTDSQEMAVASTEQTLDTAAEAVHPELAVATEEQFIKYMSLSGLAAGFVDIQNASLAKHAEKNMDQTVADEMTVDINAGIQQWASDEWFKDYDKSQMTIQVTIDMEHKTMTVVPTPLMAQVLQDLAHAIQDCAPAKSFEEHEHNPVLAMGDKVTTQSFIEMFIERVDTASMVFVGKQRYSGGFKAYIANEDFGGTIQANLTAGDEDWATFAFGPLAADWYPSAEADTPLEAMLRLEHRCMEILGAIEHTPNFLDNYPYFGLNNQRLEDLECIWTRWKATGVKADSLDDIPSGKAMEALNGIIDQVVAK